ncbi:MAG TPA: phytoene/squalene synthase family protein [Beijerinckiaceae bacterium]|jgi:phytoene synthase|nr:phytoene/squalene synthase family protein [Beijerinckiaceae bacterium]
MSELAEAYAACEQALRTGDRDRWLASLFVPAQHRPHVHALYAFSHEVARAREAVSDPRLGEIRLQWWREVVEGGRDTEAQANPLSQALLDTIVKFNLPRSALVNLIEARRFDLYDDPMPSLNDLEGYCGETCSALFRLCAIICAGGRDPGGGEVAGHAGCAYAMAGLLRALPWQAARGQCYLPSDVLSRHGALVEAATAGLDSPALREALADLRERIRFHLKAARSGLAQIPEEVRPVFAPLAFVEPWLKAMEKRGYEPFRTLIDPPQWRLQWALARWPGRLPR